MRGIGEMLSCFSYAHHLQGLFAADTRTHFKISLQGSGRNIVLSGQGFNRNGELIFLKTLFQYFTYNIYRVQ
jgi:hypothetical protein